jgi:GTP-binding protein HflX
LLEKFPDSLPLSALRGKGIEALLGFVEDKLHARMAYLSVTIPYARGDLVNLFHKRGTIDTEQHTDLGTYIEGKLPAYLALQFDEL